MGLAEQMLFNAAAWVSLQVSCQHEFLPIPTVIPTVRKSLRLYRGYIRKMRQIARYMGVFFGVFL